MPETYEVPPVVCGGSTWTRSEQNGVWSASIGVCQCWVTPIGINSWALRVERTWSTEGGLPIQEVVLEGSAKSRSVAMVAAHFAASQQSGRMSVTQ